MQSLIYFVYKILVSAFAVIYQAEGLNIPLRIMPTHLIGETLRRYGAQVGRDVRIKPSLTIHNAAIKPQSFYQNLSIGSDCFLGRELFLDLQDRVVIEDNVTISHRVAILTHTDVGQSPLKDHGFPPSQAPVKICRGAYIGAGAMILPGVEIGTCAIVGAGAVITKDVEAETVVVGVPARLLRKLALQGDQH